MRRIIIAFAVVLLGTACASTRSARTGSEQPTYLEVDNAATLDMNIYVLRSGGSRERLGTAVAHTRQLFRIPDRMIFGLTPLRFQADPIGGDRTPVSQEITVEPGDTVVLRIPPG